MSFRKKELRIAVMGATGSGKSAFINLVSGSDMTIGHSLESCTAEVRTSKPFLLNGCIVTLIDTPGFDDTTRSDTDILSSIAAYLSNTYEHGAKLTGIVYMHRISDIRMGGTSKRNFRMFRELCGDSTLRNVLIVTNMWGNVDPKVGEAREKQLVTNDKFFKPALEKGARLLRHDGTQESAQAILGHFADVQDATLLIQDEIVNQRKDLAHTAAGTELDRAFREQVDRHDEELKMLRQEMEAAMRAKDEETRLELQDEVNKKREEMERIKRDSERMAADFIAEKARLESQIVQMEAERRRYVQQLEGLQEQVIQAHKKVETWQIEHAQREADMLKSQKEEEERAARQLEEEHKAREVVEAEKKWMEVQHTEQIRIERERALAPKADLLHQAKVREEEVSMQVEQERERATLRYQLANTKEGVGSVLAEQMRSKGEAIQVGASETQSMDLGRLPQGQGNNIEAQVLPPPYEANPQCCCRMWLRNTSPSAIPSQAIDLSCHRGGNPALPGSAMFSVDHGSRYERNPASVPDVMARVSTSSGHISNWEGTAQPGRGSSVGRRYRTFIAWGTVTTEDGNAQEHQYTTSEMIKSMFDKHSELLKNNTTQSPAAHQILTNTGPIALQIQRELAQAMEARQGQIAGDMLGARAQPGAVKEETDGEGSQEQMWQKIREQARGVSAELEKTRGQATRLASDQRATLRRIEQMLQVKQG